ncbi:hypothetical protein ACS3QZ_16570 [Shimia sp. W99]
MYTLTDLDEARKNQNYWNTRFADNRSNNPNKYYAERRDASRLVRIIEKELKASGKLPLTAQELLEKKLDEAFPYAKSKQIVVFEGRRYQRKFWPLETSRSRKTVKEWGRGWVDLEKTAELRNSRT